MLGSILGWVSRVISVSSTRRMCYSLVRKAGFTRQKSSREMKCCYCSERLEFVMLQRYIHTFAGETFSYPRFVATMCSRCAWISEGDEKVPVWKWIKNLNSEKEFFLKNERAGLLMRISQIEEELKSRPTLMLLSEGNSSEKTLKL